MGQKIRWYSEVEIINVETGEIITKSEFERGEFNGLSVQCQCLVSDIEQ